MSLADQLTNCPICGHPHRGPECPSTGAKHSPREPQVESFAHRFAAIVNTISLGAALIELPPTSHQSTPIKGSVILVFEDQSEFGFFFNGSFWTRTDS
jgi:hypothetical protein